MRKSPARKRCAAMLLLAACLSSASAHGQKPQQKRQVKDSTAPAAPPAASSPARNYALVIGNNNYALKTELLRDATRDQILTALVNYRRNLTPDANLLLYYAGHGILDSEAGEAYWVQVDGDKNNNMNWISADDITRAVRAIRVEIYYDRSNLN